MPILAVDLGLVNDLLAKVVGIPLERGLLTARMTTALQVFTRYIPIIDIITLRFCTQTHKEYETLNNELQNLEDIALRVTLAETLL